MKVETCTVNGLPALQRNSDPGVSNIACAGIKLRFGRAPNPLQDITRTSTPEKRKHNFYPATYQHLNKIEKRHTAIVCHFRVFFVFCTVKTKRMAGNDCCIKRSAIILGAFMLFFALWYFNIAVRPFEDSIGSSRTLHYTLNYLLAGLIPTGALFLLHARRDIASSMGLSHGFGTGLLFAVTATLPMITGYAVIGEFDRELSADEAFTWIFIAGMFEELVYRGRLRTALQVRPAGGFCPRHCWRHWHSDRCISTKGTTRHRTDGPSGLRHWAAFFSAGSMSNGTTTSGA